MTPDSLTEVEQQLVALIAKAIVKEVINGTKK